MEKSKILKGFNILEKDGRTGNVYYQLEVETMKGKKATMFMTECQKDLVDEVGKEKCYVDIEARTSKDNKQYSVVALHVGEETFDFFVKDRAFVSLARAHAKANK